MPPLRVVVVGCGLIGSRRARITASHPDSTLAGVVDVREEAARALAVESGTRWLTDWTRVVADPGVDVVVVSTSNDQLMPIGVAALEAGKEGVVKKAVGRKPGGGPRVRDPGAPPWRRPEVRVKPPDPPAAPPARGAG